MDPQPRARGRGAAAVVDVAGGGDALCDYGLECLLTIIRTLRMGSCLSSTASDGSSPAAAFSGRSSGSKKQQQMTRRAASRKAAAPRSASLEAMRRIPGRMFLNGASGIASMFTQQGKKGTNQDAMIVWENFCARSDTIFCGVFDGHGPFGHVVARRVRDSLPLKLSSHLEVEVDNISCKENNNLSKEGSMNSEESSSLNLEEKSRVSVDLKQKENHSDMLMGFKRSFLKAFKVVDKELRVHPNIDCFFSGTTAVTLLKQGHNLVIGNVGDSRAIMGTRDQNDRLVAVQLTVDLKPNLPREAERIRRCKGRVFALRDEPKVARLWLPNNNAPGLSMARAFGDFCLKDFGLISVPEVSYRRITEKDEFIVLATDGVWDVLSNEQVVAIVASAPDRSNASRTIVNAAVRSWRFKHPTSRIDDCAVVCLFLNTEENVSSTKESCNSWSLNSTEAGEDAALDPSNPASVERSTTIQSSRILQQHNINT